MKKSIRVASFAFLSVVALSACQKEQKESLLSMAGNTGQSVSSSWAPINNWASEPAADNKSFNGSIADSSITDEILSNGLVLLYAKNGTIIEALPSTHSATGDIAWNYQVSQGMISVNGKLNGQGVFNKEEPFSYFILSKDQIDALEKKDKNVNDLLNSSYDNLQTLLQN